MEFIKPSEQFDLKGFYLEITSKCNLRCLHCYNESGIRAQVEKFLNVVKKDFPVHSDFPAVNILLIVN